MAFSVGGVTMHCRAMTESQYIDRQVYQDPDVYHRFLEFLGGDKDENTTAVYVTHTDGLRVLPELMQDVGAMRGLMEKGLDIDRSLLDRTSLLVHLDIEYVNFDSPAECYANPERSFKLQEPVIAVIEELLLKYGIRPLHLLTGQGHHFIWRVEKESNAMADLIALAPMNPAPGSAVPGHDLDLESHVESGTTAFHGLAWVMEFLAHEIKKHAAPRCAIPVELTAVHVGHSADGYREMISIDISEYGDPLWTRVIRMPFSNYLKPWKNGVVDALAESCDWPPIFTVPLHEIDVASALKIRNSAEKTKELAHRACVRIPEQSRGMARLMAAYRSSPLRKFHQDYDAELTEEAMELSKLCEQLPPCAAYILNNPYDLLLKPSGMKLVVRCLLGLGMGPRQIGCLIADIFNDAQYDWDCNWDIYSPDMRAHFYTRLFAGQISVALDEAEDFNCVSTQEQGFCFDADGCSLDPWCKKLTHK